MHKNEWIWIKMNKRESKVLTWHIIYKAITVASASCLHVLFLTLMRMGRNYPKAMKQLGKHIAKKPNLINK